MSNTLDKVSSLLNENEQFAKVVVNIYNKNKSSVESFIEKCLILKKIDTVKLKTVYDLLDKNDKKKKRKQISINFDDDEESPEIVPKISKPNGPVRFKKIDKVKAEGLKAFHEIVKVPTKQDSIIEKPTAVEETNNDRLIINDTNSEVTLINSPIQIPQVEKRDVDDGLSDGITDVEDDRAWYGVEDYYNDFDDEELELETQQQIARHIKEKNIYTNKKQSNRNSVANDLWMNNQLNKSLGKGHHLTTSLQTVSDDEQEETVSFNIAVDHLVPPFLKDEKVELTTQRTLVEAVKDPEGDLAMMAKKGSFLVQEKRHEIERQKHDKHDNLGDTKIGKVMGIKEKELEDEENAMIDQEDDPESNEPVNIAEQRKSLPVFSVKDDLVKTILENQVVVIVGETGSGKTTQIPQYLRDSGITTHGKMIGVTQPRRVAAMSVAQRVSEEIGCKLGDEVGYLIRFEDVTSSKTEIKFMTDGILVRECLMDDTLDKYSCIVIDEAHERALNADLLLGLFKSILHKRRDLKLIITSATINADKFSRFFGNAPQFDIPGRTFPVEILSNAHNVTDYVESCIQQVLKIHSQSQSKGDILCFMTGQEDIEICCQVLHERLREFEHMEPLKILPIYSTLPSDLQSKIFNKSKFRKCIVSTNIAETSLTVDGVRFVIDCGLSKLKIYNPKLNMDTLQVCPISVAQANQRSGRAGRTGPGVCFRLYTLTQQEQEMYPQPIPEIQRTNLSNTLLLLKNLGIKDLVQFPFMDSPPLELITSSLYELWLLGTLDNFGNLTELGKLMSKFPLEPSLSKLLIKSVEFNCSEEIITIVSMLSVPQIFIRSKERQQESDQARLRFQILESDHLTLLNVFNIFKQNGSLKWCLKNFLNLKNLRRAADIRSQIMTVFKSLKLPIRSSGFNNDELVLKCLCSTFYLNSAKFQKFGKFTNLKNGLTVILHPTSSLYSMNNFPDYIIYHEILLTSKEYMNYVSVVRPEWLLEFGDNYYTLKNEVEGFDNSKHLQFVENLDKDAVRYEEKIQNVKSKKVAVNKKPMIKFRSRRGF